jgi:hypothetical protein
MGATAGVFGETIKDMKHFGINAALNLEHRFAPVESNDVAGRSIREDRQATTSGSIHFRRLEPRSRTSTTGR